MSTSNKQRLRPPLQAKRGPERTAAPHQRPRNNTAQRTGGPQQRQQGLKRPNNDNDKYSANDRLKRLRADLTAKAVTQQKASSVPQQSRRGKRPGQSNWADQQPGGQAKRKVTAAPPAQLPPRTNSGGGAAVATPVSDVQQRLLTNVDANVFVFNGARATTTNTSEVFSKFRFQMPGTNAGSVMMLGNNSVGSIAAQSASSTRYSTSPVTNSNSLLDDSYGGQCEESMEWSDNETSEGTAPAVITDIAQPTNTTSPRSNKPNTNNVYIVVDTNVLLSNLRLIQSIVQMNANNNDSSTFTKSMIVYIPWMVIEELDFIKDDTNQNAIKLQARTAVKYINEILAKNNGRIIGQTLDEANSQRDSGKSPDNKIIACLLQVHENYHGDVILLSNDINVRSKAMIHNIQACSDSDIMNKLKSFNDDSSLNNRKKKKTKKKKATNSIKVQQILNEMKVICTAVIQECATNAYGVVWRKMDMLKTKPKSLQDCLLIFRKYWQAVFSDVLLKQCKKLLDEDLNTFLMTNNNIDDNNSKQLDELVRLCVRVCLFFKDVHSSKDLVETSIRKLNEIKDS